MDLDPLFPDSISQDNLTIPFLKKHILAFNNWQVEAFTNKYDITELEFGDTFFIGNNSTDVNIHQITVFNDRIFAATEDGIFYADSANPNLIDFNNWNIITSANNNFKNITVFNNKLYTILNTQLYEVNEMNELEFIKDFF